MISPFAKRIVAPAIFATVMSVALPGCVQQAAVQEPTMPDIDVLAVETPPPAELFSTTIIHSIDHSEPMVPDWSVPGEADVLQRIRDGYGLTDSEQASIDRQLNWYSKHPEYLDRVFTRSGRYLHYIATEIAARGMPMEIALLPVVESAYDPFAYSHGRAAGLWQFIPGTGRRYGMQQNWWFDGRRDVVDSTQGALDYLEYLAGLFDGDWLLAVAAYNSGEGNVGRAVRRHRKAGKPIDFWSLSRSLPVETRSYVPKLLAISRLVADPAKFGVALPTVVNQPYFSLVDTGGQIDLALAADLAGVSVEEIYALNPGNNRWATNPDGPNRLLVPVAAATEFEKNLSELPEQDKVHWERYRIRNGDSLIAIAQRFNTTPELIKDINGIRGSTIRAGDFLMIPRSAKGNAYYTHSAEARLAKTMSTPKGGQKTNYTVRSGDSLWSISRRHNVNTRSLAKWNGMAPGDTLSVGRELVIWGGSRVVANSSTGGPPAGRVRKLNYTVRQGDSLWKISSRFKVTVNQLKNWNSLSGKRYLRPGQKLVMYVDITQQSGG